jgi:hypothetical protein
MKMFILLSVCAALMGCATAVPAPATVSYLLVLPPSEMLKDCALIAPPDVKAYTAATADQKEGKLYDFAMAQLTSLSGCNQQWQALRGWVGQQKRIYPTK